MKWQNKFIFQIFIVALWLIAIFELSRGAGNLKLYARLNSKNVYAKKDGLPTRDDKEKALLRGNTTNNNEYEISQEKEKNDLTINVTNAQTGSFSNCTQREPEPTIEESHSDSGTLTVSCGTVQYRVPIHSFNTITSPIIVGVLSNAGDNGPIRRDTIRNTWAKNQSGVFFLVAGPWEAISNEYEGYGDLIWIDEEEVYNKEHSVLSLKTLSFLSILYTMSEKIPTLTYSYAFKTDDDSYVDIHALHATLTNTTSPPDYWGSCVVKNGTPERGDEYKWHISFEDYPNQFWPLYCRGAGYALSRTFVDCASIGGHIGQLLPIPIEDIAVGMLAERCDAIPVSPNTGKLISVNRYSSEEARRRIRFGESMMDMGPAPPACMTGKILQHRIVNEEDMKNHYRTVVNPSFCDVMKERQAVELKEFRRQRREVYLKAKKLNKKWSKMDALNNNDKRIYLKSDK